MTVVGMYQKDLDCPICQKPFKSSKLKQNAVKLEKRDEDFCGYYAGENPTFYAVYICPNCGYSAFESDFDTVNDLQRTAVINHITPKWQYREFSGARTLEDAVSVHQLCLLNYSVMQKKPSELAKICLRLSWFYRFQKNDEREQHFMKFALLNYRKAFEVEPLEEDIDNQLTIYYLLGELSRRLGEYKDALYWFQETLKLPHIKTKKQMETLTRDQILLAKEGYSKLKKT
jgi:uncharacterized protein (DUF2225 family)